MADEETGDVYIYDMAVHGVASFVATFARLPSSPPRIELNAPASPGPPYSFLHSLW